MALLRFISSTKGRSFLIRISEKFTTCSRREAKTFPREGKVPKHSLMRTCIYPTLKNCGVKGFYPKKSSIVTSYPFRNALAKVSYRSSIFQMWQRQKTKIKKTGSFICQLESIERALAICHLEAKVNCFSDVVIVVRKKSEFSRQRRRGRVSKVLLVSKERVFLLLVDLDTKFFIATTVLTVRRKLINSSNKLREFKRLLEKRRSNGFSTFWNTETQTPSFLTIGPSQICLPW